MRRARAQRGGRGPARGTQKSHPIRAGAASGREKSGSDLFESPFSSSSESEENASGSEVDSESDSESDQNSELGASDIMDDDCPVPAVPHVESASVAAFYSQDFGHAIQEKIIRTDNEMRAVVEGVVDTLSAADTECTPVSFFGSLYQVATHLMRELLESAKVRSQSAEDLRKKSSAEDAIAAVKTRDIARAASRRQDPEARAIREGNRLLSRLAAVLTLMQSLCGDQLAGAVPDAILRQTASLVSANIVTVLLRDTSGTVAAKIAMPAIKLAHRYLAALVSGPASPALWKKAKAKDGAPVCQELLTSVLAQVLAGKPASRRASLEIVAGLVALDPSGYAGQSAAKFQIAILSATATTSSAQKKLLMALRLTSETLPLLADKSLQDSLLRSLLKLLNSANINSMPFVASAVFGALEKLATRHASAELSAQLFQIFMDHRPSPRDVPGASSWVNAACVTLLILLSTNGDLAFERLPHFLDALLSLLQSEIRVVSENAAAAAQRIVVAFLGGTVRDLTIGATKRKSEPLEVEESLRLAQHSALLDGLRAGSGHPIFLVLQCVFARVQSALKFAFMESWDLVCRVASSAASCVSRALAVQLRSAPSSAAHLFSFMQSSLSDVLSQLLAVRKSQREKMEAALQQKEDPRGRQRRKGLRPGDHLTKHVAADSAIISIARCVGLRHFLATIGTCFPSVPPASQPFLSPAQLNSEQPLFESNLWVLPFVAEGGLDGSGSLDDFVSTVTPVIRLLQDAAATHSGAVVVARKLETLVEQLWALFPAVAKGAFDVPATFASFAQLSGPILLDPTRSWEIKRCIIQGLSSLVSFARQQLEIPTLAPAAKERHLLDISTVASSCEDFLQCLFSLYLVPPVAVESGDAANRVRRVVSQGISALLYVASMSASAATTIPSMFKKIMSRLLNRTVTTTDASTLVDLSLCFVEFLDDKSLSLLFRALEPYLLGQVAEAREAGMQNKAFKVLAQLCARRASDFLQPNIEAVFKLLLQHLLSLGADATLAPPQFAVMGAVTASISIEQLLQWLQGTAPYLPSPIPVILLGFRSSKARARAASRDTIHTLGQRVLESNGHAGLKTLVSLFAVGLAGRSSHFQSATLGCLTHLLHSFEERLVESEVSSGNGGILVDLMRAATTLMDWHTADVRQAAIRLLLALVKPTFASASVSAALLPSYQSAWSTAVGACLKAPDDVKAKVRSDLKALLERLIKKWGFDVVRASCPPSQLKFANNVRKAIVRAKRAKQNSAKPKPTTDKQVPKRSSKKKVGAFQDDESDSDSDAGFAQWDSSNMGDLEDYTEDVMDLTSTQSSAVSKRERARAPKVSLKLDGDGDIRMADDGRLVIGGVEDSLDDEGPIRPKRKRGEDDNDDQDEDDDALDAAKPILPAKRVKADNDKFGSEYYRSKAGQSDVKKKGSKYEPFAYLPLNPKFLNKRRRLHAHKQYDNVASAGHRRRQNK